MSSLISISLSRTAVAFAAGALLPVRPNLFRFTALGRTGHLVAATTLRAARLHTPGPSMSAVELISPKEAHARASGSSRWMLIDVRSEGEFEQGHPSGSINVPVMNASAAGMTPNPSFLDDILSAVGGSKDVKILISCQSGKRSKMACAKLAEDGFSVLGDVDGGYSAWAQDESLPVAKL